jgi:hypothetical protein
MFDHDRNDGFVNLIEVSLHHSESFRLRAPNR